MIFSLKEMLIQAHFGERPFSHGAKEKYIQFKHKTLPEYAVLEETGPDHEKTFTIGVYLKKVLLGSGKGHSKKEAEQAAAKMALKKINAKKIKKKK